MEEIIMKKKVLALLLSSAMTAALLAGCGSDNGTTGSSNSTANNTTNNASTTGSTAGTDANGAETGTDSANEGAADGQVYKIGICQLIEHEALDAATQGFEQALIDLVGEDSVEFYFQNAQGEQTNCATIATTFVSDGVDLILANATAPLQAAAAATNEIPILGTSITDYATALDISDWNGTTGTNVSGASDLAPIDEQEAMLVELFPDVEKVGILYCSAEPNSKYQADLFIEALEADGIDYEEYTAADSNEIQSVVTSACESCDVLYIPTDNTMAAATETINNICLPAGVPVIASEEGICRGCGVATLSINYFDIGYTAGEMAYEVLVNGADVSTMDIRYASEVTKKYNEVIAAELGITIPEDYSGLGVE
ncbi:MAG: ABC transporter substrate-binding protein [Lachnospiraceae bacterium]|nr:ABC transporter substrate-binding protein [Lachnospiraceae bacterium]